MAGRHNVFVSYYHEEDQHYRNRFETLFSKYYDIMESKSVEIDDINPNLKTETVYQQIRNDYLRNSTVTVVLVGTHTWRRKFVDWEIGSSIRQTEYNPRSGLLGILLPTYSPVPPIWERYFTGDTLPASQSQQGSPYNPHTIPPRLYDNLVCRYATIHSWSENPIEVKHWIHEAFKRRKKINPNNKRLLFKNNRSTERWQQ